MPTKRGEIQQLQVLTNFSLKYANGAMVADEVLPRLTVKKDSDKYRIYDRTDRRIFDTLRANAAPANHVNTGEYSTATYTCDKHALKDAISDDDRQNADSDINLEMDVTETLTNNILIAREKRVADLVTAAGTFATSGNTLALAGVQQWNNTSFSTSGTAIEERMDNAKEVIRQSIGVDANTVIIPANVARVVKRDPAVRDLIKQTHSDLLVNGDLPPILWNMRVVIPGAIQNTAALGASYSGADVWGKHVLLFYRAPNISLKSMTFGLSPVSKPRAAKRWREENIESDWIEIEEKIDELVTCEYAGYLYTDVIS